jgi:hypothetical protein
MRIGVILGFFVLLASQALAAISTGFYLSDGNTPLALRDPNVPRVYRDIMVGTKLTVIVSSDRRTGWGKISTFWEDWAKGHLTARDYNDVSNTWDGSCLPAAGRHADVTYTTDNVIRVYNFYCGASLVSEGKWFIFDYLAIAPGACTITVTQLSPKPVLVTDLTLRHVPSRDFNGDTVVNLKDFALFANLWRTSVAADLTATDAPFDLDADHYVGPSDLTPFARFWLERTDVNTPIPDPNKPSAHLQP